jgi:hypothetical protein
LIDNKKAVAISEFYIKNYFEIKKHPEKYVPDLFF